MRKNKCLSVLHLQLYFKNSFRLKEFVDSTKYTYICHINSVGKVTFKK